ncbi:hypothetical protein Vadar_022703 [Vaccinium darrowii]|uniref:Uncharacterized protein n=1 Tax=Vaccinium darrowii TaxID=229202 RepID=A0ACB7Z6Y9_9ERIC|nr:hypothetical protein Vadar_022703 [Vaccinium darrowii]
MLITERGIVPNICSYLVVKKHGRKSGSTKILAQKRDLEENSCKQEGPIFPLRVSNTILAQSAVAVLGLGFIDAGYSGDWSRIGVISKETEVLLKLAAFVVVPLCLFLIISFSKKHEA